MKKGLLIVSALVTALSLQTGLTSADSTKPAPLRVTNQKHDPQKISEKQPVTQQESSAKKDNKQDPAPVILRIKIVKDTD